MTYQESRLSVLNLLFWTINRHNVRTTLARGEGNTGIGFRLDVFDIDVFFSEQFTVKLVRNQHCLVDEVAILNDPA